MRTSTRPLGCKNNTSYCYISQLVLEYETQLVPQHQEPAKTRGPPKLLCPSLLETHCFTYHWCDRAESLFTGQEPSFSHSPLFFCDQQNDVNQPPLLLHGMDRKMPDCCTGVRVCEDVILFLMQAEESLQISRGILLHLGSAYFPGML